MYLSSMILLYKLPTNATVSCDVSSVHKVVNNLAAMGSPAVATGNDVCCRETGLVEATTKWRKIQYRDS